MVNNTWAADPETTAAIAITKTAKPATEASKAVPTKAKKAPMATSAATEPIAAPHATPFMRSKRQRENTYPAKIPPAKPGKAVKVKIKRKPSASVKRFKLPKPNINAPPASTKSTLATKALAAPKIAPYSNGFMKSRFCT